MNNEETGKVVAYLNRAGLIYAMENQVAVWHDLIGRLRYADVVEACRNIGRDEAAGGRLGGSFLTPGAVAGEVRRLRARRSANHVVPAPPEGLEDDTAAQLQFHRAYMGALGDGAGVDGADAAACSAVGVTRPPAVAADPARMKRVLDGMEVPADE